MLNQICASLGIPDVSHDYQDLVLAAEIRAVREAGVTGYRDIADALNARGVPTPRGARWHPASVHKQMKRLGMNA